MKVEMTDEITLVQSKRTKGKYYVGNRSVCGNYFCVWGEGMGQEEAMRSYEEQIAKDEPVCLMIE
jgi:hypothetical protein